MSMHICPVYFTTTVSRKHNPTLTAKQKTALATHHRWVETMTKGKKPDKAVLDKMWRAEYNESMTYDRSAFQKRGITSGACAKPDEKVYTGGNLLGIATMHKSNMVPVFKASDAEDIARMRRG